MGRSHLFCIKVKPKFTKDIPFLFTSKQTLIPTKTQMTCPIQSPLLQPGTKDCPIVHFPKKKPWEHQCPQGRENLKKTNNSTNYCTLGISKPYHVQKEKNNPICRIRPLLSNSSMGSCSSDKGMVTMVQPPESPSLYHW